MGMLDDAIREHLELKRRSGAPEEEVNRLESDAFGSARREPPAIEEPSDQPTVEDLPPPPGGIAEPATVHLPVAAPEPAPEPASVPERRESWLSDEDDEDEPEVRSSDQSTSEFSASEAHEAAGAPPSDYVAPDEEGDDLLEETPDFLQETPEHDRLWFEQKPPRDFDFD